MNEWIFLKVECCEKNKIIMSEGIRSDQSSNEEKMTRPEHIVSLSQSSGAIGWR